MNSGEDTRGMHSVQNLSRGVSVVLLLLHFYYFCYDAFREWRLTATIGDRVLGNIARTGLFAHLYTSKGIALLFLVLSSVGMQGRKDARINPTTCFLLIGVGLLIYFGSYILFTDAADLMTSACLYMGLNMAGYLLVGGGIGRLSRVVPAAFRKDFFNEQAGKLQQEERLIETEFSINLSARYPWKGRLRESYINFINPRRGILILGSPGSGKSWFIIEPAIRQLIEKGFSLFVYDFKYSALTKFVYYHFLRHRKKYPRSASFYSINFSDLSRSHRCNLIDPITMEYLSDAIGASRTILLSMNKTWVNRQGEFFVESPVNFLAALIWYLKKYKNGAFCTLPHVIELAQAPYDKLFTVLSAEPEIQTLINPFVEAYRNKTMELLDSQVASAKIPLSRLTSPDLYYILTGNDFSLDINNPLAPKILCLGGDPPRQDALAPIMSLYIDRLNKQVNRQGKYKCAIVCDEFATVRAASLLDTIATARSNNIIPIMAVQDLSQLRTRYSRDEADQILNISGNLISGQVGGETARSICERFPSVTDYRKSVSVHSTDTSFSSSEHSTGAVSPSTLATLSSGEFVGIVADDPGEKLALKAFHATIVKEKEDMIGEPLADLPMVKEVSEEEVQDSFMRVKREVETLVEEEMERILGDPGLRRRVVKK
jgi:hypothetical protein